MISDTALKVGLAALALITGAKLDPETVQIWRYATRELVDEQWRFGVDMVVRTWKYHAMPPPAVVIDAAYMAPLPPARDRPIRENGELWSSEEQARWVEQIVHDNPREPNETAVRYAERIAILAGLTGQAAAPIAGHRDPGQEG